MSTDRTADRKVALLKMQKLCSSREKCRSEITEKLLALRLNENDIAWVLNKLEEDRFIDESRYCSFFVRDKFRLNHWGRLKIRYALQQKKIDTDTLESALSLIDQEEYSSVLKEEIRKKNRSIKESNDFKRRGKLFQFASGRGFESGLIFEVLDEVVGG